MYLNRTSNNFAVSIASDYTDNTEVCRITKKDFRKATSDHSIVSRTEDRLRCMFARTATTKIVTTHQDGGFSEARIIEIVILIFATLSFTDVVEEILS